MAPVRIINAPATAIAGVIEGSIGRPSIIGTSIVVPFIVVFAIGVAEGP